MDHQLNHLLRFDRCAIGRPGAPILADFSWTAAKGETWIVTGPNGGGKSALAAAIAGDLPVQGEWSNAHAGDCALVSFDRQQDIVLEELRNDDSDFVEGGVDPGTSLERFILDGAQPSPAFRDLCARFGVDGLLGRGIKYLSTGEIRKALLCRELLKNRGLLVLDDLMEGLDAAARDELARTVDAMLRRGRPRLVVVSERYDNLPGAADRVLCLAGRRVAFSGGRAEFEAGPLRRGLADGPGADLSALDAVLDGGAAAADALVEMRGVRVAWDGRRVLDGFDWTLEPGGHTLVLGPNGCGKSTLLRLVTGDNPQVYANDVKVLGFRRGGGESVWQVKAGIGFVSYQLHLDFRGQATATVEETLLSGFRDSVGLYESPSGGQVEKALAWLRIMGMEDRRKEAFSALSYGEQRAALVARAAIKSPRLLILDEPCHGLDAVQRRRVLDIAEHIGAATATTLLYVTHDPAERLACTRRIIEFVPAEADGSPDADGLLPPRFAPRFRDYQPSR